MKLIIEVTEDYYKYLKDKMRNRKATISDATILDGTPYEERPQSEWIITGEEQGALGITYKKRKCNKCGWKHSLVIPNNFCPNCGADMGGKENDKVLCPTDKRRV